MKHYFYLFLALCVGAVVMTSCKPKNEPKLKGVNYAQWTESLPGETRLADLTIPGLHDAATFSLSWSHPLASIMKDQDTPYDVAWSYGVRAFDMRLGYNNNPGHGDFTDRCAFYHGNQSDDICELNKFYDDIPNRFPTAEAVNNSFMILFASLENNDEPKYDLNIFEYFMRLLIERYGAERFIEYREGLTLNDVKGKIILFVCDEVFTGDYSQIGGVPQVPVNYRKKDSEYQGGNGEIITYVNATESQHYPVTIQNTWKVKDADEKYGYIQDVLNEPVPQLLINEFNATDKSPIHASWPISSKLNRMICNDLQQNPLPSQYNRSLGVIYMDFGGVESHGSHDFAGETLVKLLVEHNFRHVK